MTKHLQPPQQQLLQPLCSFPEMGGPHQKHLLVQQQENLETETAPTDDNSDVAATPKVHTMGDTDNDGSSKVDDERGEQGGTTQLTAEGKSANTQLEDAVRQPSSPYRAPTSELTSMDAAGM